MTENELSKIIVDCCYKIHTVLGPGLLESVYEEVLCYELRKNQLNYRRQLGLPVYYEEVKLDIGFRADIIVEDKVIIEIKSVEILAPSAAAEQKTAIDVFENYRSKVRITNKF